MIKKLKEVREGGSMEIKDGQNLRQKVQAYLWSAGSEVVDTFC